MEALLERLDDAVAFVDRSGRIVLTNREHELPDSPSSVRMADLGETFKIFHRDGRPYHVTEWPVLRSARTGEVIVGEEFLRVLPDGSRRSFSCNCGPLYDDQGAIAGAVLITRDITEREQAEEAQESNRRIAGILESTSDIFFAVDREWRYTYVNKRAVAQARETWGREVTAQELLGRNCWELFPETVGTPFDEELHRALRYQQVVEFETSSAVTGASIEVRAYPSKDGLSVYSHDITKRNRAREQLAYHASLLDNVEDGVIATDADDFCITAWNRGAERLYGFTAEEVVGHPAREVASYPGDRARLELEQELLETGRARIEFTAHRKDGIPIEVELIAVAVRGAEGSVTGYLGIHRDITRRNRAEEQLERRLRQQAAVAELGLTALRNGRLQPLMDEAVTLVCRTLGVEYSKVDELMPGGEQLLVSAGAGWREGTVGSAVMPTGHGSPAGFALGIGEPVIVDDMAAEARFEVPALLREHDVMSDITVVIDPPGNPFGTLVAASKKRRTFSDDDVAFMQSVANVLATAVERAHTDDRLEAAREAERSRIVRDLHDEALRELADAIAGAAMSRSSSEGEEERRWAALITSLQRVGQQVRSTVYDIRLGAQQDRAFADLLHDMVAIQAEMAAESKIELHGLEALPTRALGHRGAEALRIVREAITNARRHSGATTIRVDAGGSSEDVLHVEVSDDGDWPDRDVTGSSGQGTGITSMLERADLIGAELRIDVRTGGGTRVSIALALGNTPRSA